ncbi:MAG: hypothetical protein J7J72_05365 [Bacteroidales bacterium]|nr:hypothetical protein [Bacteroidales bacterium]
METTLLDQVILLITGLTAVYLIYRFIQANKDTAEQTKYYYHYIVSFAVLFVAGVLIILFDFAILARPEIKIVATLIPFALATGLICQFYEKYAKPYVLFLMLGFILVILQNYGVIETKLIYPIFHSIAGLTIFFVPIIVVKNNAANKGFIWVTVGSTLIGIGGIALAFLGAEKPLLGIFTAEVIFTILTPILLLMTLAYTWGFMKNMSKN